MTVIAASLAEGVMASDRHCFDDADATKHIIRKIWRVRGDLVGFAGSLADIKLALAWMRSSKIDDPPVGDAFALLMGPKGLRTWTAGDGETRIDSGAFAIGAGGPAARAAMMAGASVREAVKIASDIHTFCGGGVSVYHLPR